MRTELASKKMRLDVLAGICISTTQTGMHPQTAFQFSGWRNGHFIAASQRTE